MTPKKSALTLAALAALILGCLLPLPAYSQVAGGTIRGTITDESGAVIPSVEVVIKNVATGVTRIAQSNESGLYIAPNLLPGEYEIRASATGFRTEVRRGITLTVGSEQVVNLQMRVGAVTELVEVTGAAPAVDLATSTLSHVVAAQTIRDLPLNGRDWTQLALLQPGVSRIWAQATSEISRAQRGVGVQMSISGGRPSENNYRLNAVSINDYANTAPGSTVGVNLGVDAIQEFSVLTSTYSAEYGRTAGGVINAVTRSGTNTLHGSAYYFHRNSALDARNFFDRTPEPPPFRRHQFGAAAGGRIRRDSTFWFADYEGLREALGATQVSIVPSAAAREGRLSTGNVTVDAAVRPFLNLFPLPNGGLLAGGDVGQFSIAGQRVSNEDFVTGKVDHRFSERDSINGMFLFDDALLTVPDEFNNKPFDTPSRRYVATIEESHMFSPQVLNSARLGFTRTAISNGAVLDAFNPALKDPALGFVPGHNIGRFGVTGLTGFTGGVGRLDGNIFRYTSFQGYDDLFISKGIHSLKIGVNVERIRHNMDAADAADGQFTFTSLSNFLTNRPFQLQAILPGTDTIRGVRQTSVGAYIQDDIRWRRNLTLNLGLRYEMATEPTEVQGKLASLKNLTDTTPTVGSLFENPTLLNFAPRVGLAWDPFGNGKTSIRAGFGVFDILPLPYTFVNEFPRTPPFYSAGIRSNLPQGSFPRGAFALLTAATLRTVYVDPKPARPYKMQWNINIQRELPGDLAVTVGYVGARGVHLPWRNNNLNTVLATKTNQGYIFPPTTSAASRVINPNFGPIRAKLWNADSYYHGLQVALKKRLSRGLQAQGSYTWGRSIDTASATFSSNEFSNTTNLAIPWDNKVNRGLSDFHQQHNFVLSLLYQIPTPASWSGVGRWLAEGWQLGGIYQASTGTPFSALQAGDRAGSRMGGDSAQRPVLISSSECRKLTNPGSVSRYIKTECFVPLSFPPLTPANTIHNMVGRNTLIGPGLSNLDFSLFKNTYVRSISESFNIQFRAEFFNALNRANFDFPSDFRTIFDAQGRSVTAAGRLTNTLTGKGRLIQFGIKFIW